MEKRNCRYCGKTIEGFNENHVEFLLNSHEFKHKRTEALKSKKKVTKK